MRNRIQTNDEKGGASFLAEKPRDLLKDNRIAPVGGSDDLVRAPAIKPPAGIEAKIVPERTSTPLKMVFIVRLDSSSQEISASPVGRLAEALIARGHRLLILEHKQQFKKKLEPPPLGQLLFYASVRELKDRFTAAIRKADFVMMGSNVSEAAVIGEWVTHIALGTTAIYDLNTPATLAKIDRGESQYLTPSLIPRFQLYLSLTGGPLLELVKRYYGAPMVRPLYGSVDISRYYPEKGKLKWDLGYSANFDEDRLPGVDELLLEPARHWPSGKFVAVGRGFLPTADWPDNVKRLTDVAAGKERDFYNAQRFALNVTGADMIEAGFSPAVGVFEAAACGTPIISDYWEDLETFFTPDEEILFARSAEEVLEYLRGVREDERLRIGDNARRRILSEHSGEQRAIELENYAMEALQKM
jgi:spore maturation protein CgeB